jgi:hypothetical protein
MTEIRFDDPQSAVTPGQLAVLYQGDRALGGGPIVHALKSEGRVRSGDGAAIAGAR